VSAPLKKHGTCHLFGDDVPHDEGIMAFKYAIERVTDPKLLIPHLFEQVAPGFGEKVKPGDVVLAGKNFGYGKPHVQGYIAMAALGMGVVCESMPHKSLRRAMASGLPVLTGCANYKDFAKDGDEVEIDFTTGAARNHTTGKVTQFNPMPTILQEIIVQGGAEGNMRAFLQRHPELAIGSKASAA
jgi:3-isopropylmalate/(R)-2-methylmalate dehydratase small subunit